MYCFNLVLFFFFFSSRRRHTRCSRDWSSDVCSSDLMEASGAGACMGHTGVKPGTVRPDPSQPLILVYCSLALVQCTTTRGELATGRRPSRHILEIGRASCRERV